MSESESGAKGECVCGRRPKDFVSKYGGGSADGLKSEPAPKRLVPPIFD